MEALFVELRGVGGVGLGAVGGVVVCVGGGAGVRGVVDVGGGDMVVVLVLAVLLVVMAPLVRLWFKDRCMSGCWGVCAASRSVSPQPWGVGSSCNTRGSILGTRQADWAKGEARKVWTGGRV